MVKNSAGMAVTDTLKSCALFKGFTETGLQILSGICAERSFAKGMVLFAENMAADSMFILASGTVALSVKNDAGTEVFVGELSAGEFLGELSLIQQGQRMCTATAKTGVAAVEIRHAEFQKLLASKPQACLKLLMGIVSTFGQKVLDNRATFKSLLT